MSKPVKEPESICILRLSAIGDVCHAVAAVQAIQRRWPQAKITWVIGKVEKMLLNGLPGVEFIAFDKKSGLKGYLDLRRQMAGRRFDVLLHMQLALRASLATLAIKSGTRWGFDSGRSKEGQSLFINKEIRPQKAPHVAEGFMAFAQALGVEEEKPSQWQMPLAQTDIDWANQNAPAKPFIVIAPAASKAERNWLSERYAGFANYVHSKGFEVVICGGPTQMEESLANDIIRDCNFQPHNLVGKTSLKQLLGVLQKAVMVLAPDTGPAHMAVTVDTPVIGLYAHSNPRRTGPYKYLDYVASCYEAVLKEQTGKTSDQLRWGKRVKGEELMQRISLELVIENFERMAIDFNLYKTIN